MFAREAHTLAFSFDSAKRTVRKQFVGTPIDSAANADTSTAIMITGIETTTTTTIIEPRSGAIALPS